MQVTSKKCRGMHILPASKDAAGPNPEELTKELVGTIRNVGRMREQKRPTCYIKPFIHANDWCIHLG